MEEQFYLIFPFILAGLFAWKFQRRGWMIIAILFMATVVIRWLSLKYLVLAHEEDGSAGYLWYRWIYYPTYTRLDGLLVGISIAAAVNFSKSIKDWVGKYSSLLLLVGILVLVSSYFLFEDQMTIAATVAGFSVIAIDYGLLVAGSLASSSWLNFLCSKLTDFLAAISYSLYLVHKGMIHVIHKFSDQFKLKPDGNLMLIVCLLGSILAATLLRYAVEKPFLRLGRRGL